MSYVRKFGLAKKILWIGNSILNTNESKEISMGCDIHLVLEQKDIKSGEWVGINDFPYVHSSMNIIIPKEQRTTDQTSSPYFFWKVRGRSYTTFKHLAGVRAYAASDVPEPNGIPEDASSLAKLRIREWGPDGHSHSYLSMREFAIRCVFADMEENEEDPVLRTIKSKDEIDYLVNTKINSFFEIDISDLTDLYDGDDIPEFRVVFWFDN